MTTVEHLDPSRKLVDEVADWLCGTGPHEGGGRVKRTSEGAASLDHVLVVVPTAQSGRNLRLALARRAAGAGWGAVLPPRITMPSGLLVPADVRIATEAEELAVLAEILLEADLSEFAALLPHAPAEPTVDWALRLAKSVLDVSHVLGEGGLRMSDVRSTDDADRWRDLARLEERLTAALSAHGALTRSGARQKAIAAGCAEKGIAEIVLPSSADLTSGFIRYLENSPVPVTVLLHADRADAAKFDAWGRPTGLFAASLPPAAISAFPTAVLEADAVARFFRAVGPDEALPALAVCDAASYPELEGAFQNHFAADELALRNPSRTPLAHSSLGRLLASVLALSSDGDYETLSTFLRTADVARWAAAELGVATSEVASWVGALDAVQNTRLPRTLDETLAAARREAEVAYRAEARAAAAGLVRLVEAVKAHLGDPLAFLRRLFDSLELDERNPGDRELIAAAEAYRDLRRDCASELVPARIRRALEIELLKGAGYMLEPTAPNVLATTGWLEVAWCAEDELVISGFNEGCVPENIVGHPFVPDSLRGELGLLTNETRGLRDAFILAEAVSCRPAGAVRVTLHQMDAEKNVTKPSRLLFPGVSDADLPALARRLYAVTKGNAGSPPKELPRAWLLDLPLPPEGRVWRKSISVSAIDQYALCPFNFFLQETFGEHEDDREQELSPREFGTLCHEALDRFAKEGPCDSTDPGEIAAFLERCVRESLMSFGPDAPAIVELQSEAAVERLRNFSFIQAERRKAGWRIVASEQSLKCKLRTCPTEIRGKVDRVDEHETTHELAIIDYKTWSRANDVRRNTLQLPLYRAMVGASRLYDAERARAAKAFYCVLGARAEDTLFDEAHACHEGLQAESEQRVIGILTDIARGVFYPPRNPDWSKTYGQLVWESPEKGLSPAWLEDQRARREAAE